MLSTYLWKLLPSLSLHQRELLGSCPWSKQNDSVQERISGPLLKVEPPLSAVPALLPLITSELNESSTAKDDTGLVLNVRIRPLTSLHETNSHVMLLGICLVWLLLEDKSVMFSKVGHSSTVVFSSIYPKEIFQKCFYCHYL